MCVCACVCACVYVCVLCVCVCACVCVEMEGNVCVHGACSTAPLCLKQEQRMQHSVFALLVVQVMYGNGKNAGAHAVNMQAREWSAL